MRKNALIISGMCFAVAILLAVIMFMSMGGTMEAFRSYVCWSIAGLILVMSIFQPKVH